MVDCTDRDKVYCFISAPRASDIPEISFSWSPFGSVTAAREDLEDRFGLYVRMTPVWSDSIRFDHQNLLDLTELHSSYGFNPSSTEIADYLGQPLFDIIHPAIDTHQGYVREREYHPSSARMYATLKSVKYFWNVYSDRKVVNRSPLPKGCYRCTYKDMVLCSLRCGAGIIILRNSNCHRYP